VSCLFIFLKGRECKAKLKIHAFPQAAKNEWLLFLCGWRWRFFVWCDGGETRKSKSLFCCLMTILFKQISKKRSKKGLKKKDSGAKVQFLVSKKGKYEEHNVTKNIPNHNPNNIFPVLKLKEKEGFNDCLQKAFLGALHGLDLGGVRLEVIAFIRNSFDIVLAASFKGGSKRPEFEQRNHGSLALGYKPGDITAVAKVLNPILAKSGLFLVIKSLKKMNYSKLMNLSTSQRRNRCFIIFGGALASDKRKLLAKQITNCNKSCHTIGSIGRQDLVSQTFMIRILIHYMQYV
jgi:hypothetical protein